MATDMNRLQGEVADNPQSPSLNDNQDEAIERMLVGFLRSLLDEQRPAIKTPAIERSSEIPSYLQPRSTAVGKESV